MNSFRATNKAEAGKKLALVEKEISAQFIKLNSRKLIPLLLCLEDAVNSLEIEIARSYLVENKFQEAPELLLCINRLLGNGTTCLTA